MGLPDIKIRVAGKHQTIDNYTRSKAIKAFCKDCMCGVTAEIRNCTATLCPLYAFRPYLKPAETAPGEAISASKIDDLSRTHINLHGQEEALANRLPEKGLSHGFTDQASEQVSRPGRAISSNRP
jgi:hypothetical protein